MGKEEIRHELSEELTHNSVLIPAGSFLMGSTEHADASPIHEVNLSDFFMSAYMVTNRQFALFLNSISVGNEEGGTYLWLNTFNKMCRVTLGDNGAYRARYGFETHPVAGVNWYGAYIFSLWVGGMLPTEAQMEKAIRGGKTNQLYPWGDDSPNADLVNFGENVGSTTPVGNYPPNKYGLYDISGNLAEWCIDWYSKEYYIASGLTTSKGPSKGSDKVIRGGSWNAGAERLKCSSRDKSWPRMGRTSVGFRPVFLNKKPPLPDLRRATITKD